jgi:hypothetical protein
MMSDKVYFQKDQITKISGFPSLFSNKLEHFYTIPTSTLSVIQFYGIRDLTIYKRLKQHFSYVLLIAE